MSGHINWHASSSDSFRLIPIAQWHWTWCKTGYCNSWKSDLPCHIQSSRRWISRLVENRPDPDGWITVHPYLYYSSTLKVPYDLNCVESAIKLQPTNVAGLILGLEWADLTHALVLVSRELILVLPLLVLTTRWWSTTALFTGNTVPAGPSRTEPTRTSCDTNLLMLRVTYQQRQRYIIFTFQVFSVYILTNSYYVTALWKYETISTNVLRPVTLDHIHNNCWHNTATVQGTLSDGCLTTVSRILIQ